MGGVSLGQRERGRNLLHYLDRSWAAAACRLWVARDEEAARGCRRKVC